MDLSGIEQASGLSRGDLGELRALLDVHAAHAARNRELEDFYDGKRPPCDIGIEVVPPGVDPGVRCDWARKAVTSVSERVRMDGFAFDGEYEDEGLAACARRSRLVSEFNRHVASELVHGCMFATVNRDDGGRAYVRLHSASTSAAIWDSYHGRIGSGLVVADARRTEWSPTAPVPVLVNMHLPGAVVVLRRASSSEWSSERREFDLDRPMMEAFTYRATGTRPFGETRITPAVRYLVDEVNRTLRYMAVSSAFYARPQKYVLGLNDEQFDAMMADKWQTYIGSVLLGTVNEETGSAPTVGQLASASPQPYIDALQAYGKLFSGATGVPLNSLGIVQDNPSSAEAITAQREDVCTAAEDCIESNRESMCEVALLAMAVEADASPDDLTDEQRSVVPKFSDPQRTSRAARGDYAVKVAGAAPEYPSTSQFWRDLGYGEQETSEILRSIRYAQAQSAMAAAVSQEQPVLVTEAAGIEGAMG